MSEHIPCLRPEECPAHQPVLDALRRSADAITHGAGIASDLKGSIEALHGDVRAVKSLLMVDQTTGKLGVLPRLDRLETQFDDHIKETARIKDFRLSATLQLVMLILAPIVSMIVGGILVLMSLAHWSAPLAAATAKVVAP